MSNSDKPSWPIILPSPPTIANPPVFRRWQGPSTPDTAQSRELAEQLLSTTKPDTRGDKNTPQSPEKP